MPKLRIPKITPRYWPVVRVEWTDAGGQNGWEPANGKPQVYPVVSWGLLIRRSETHIELAMDVTPDGSSNQRGCIPIGCILRINTVAKEQRPKVKP